MSNADVIVVGAGLAGLVAAAELADAGRTVIVLDQEPEASLGRPGLLVLRRPVPRRHPRAAPARVQDSHELAWQDWLGSAGFDRPTRTTGRGSGRRPTSISRRARSGPGCTQQGVGLFPLVQWAERGGYYAGRPRQLGAALPCHLGHRPGRAGAVRPPGAGGVERGPVQLRFRHRVTGLSMPDGVVDGVDGEVLEPSSVPRGVPSSRVAVGDFALRAQAVIVTSGGIGANHDLVRRSWPARLR